MTPKSTEFRIYYRLGIAPDVGPLELETSSYHGIAIGANVAAWGQSWSAGLLTRTRKPFFVDPMTYVFAQDPRVLLKEDDLRQSFARLVDQYGGILSAIAGKKPLRPTDFWKAGRLASAGHDFVDAVLTFEINGLEKGESTQLRISDYLEMIGEKTEVKKLVPEFLVPPYFHASSLDDDWYKISLAMAKHAATHRKEDKVVPVICLSDHVLKDENAMNQLVVDYGDFDSVLMWIADLDETRATVPQLVGYGRLVKRLAAGGVVPMALYGGFFALTLATAGLGGLSSGVCYAESKSVSRQATGGGAPIRYYVPWAHTKVVTANATTFYTANPREYCKCSICRAALDSGTRTGVQSRIVQAFERLDRATSGRHFMKIRSGEAQLYAGASRASGIQSLARDRRVGERTGATTLGIPIGPLIKWIDALERI
jgi:hypothetical protein